MMTLLNLSGWPRMALMLACGVMAAMALAPVFAWPLLPLAYGGLLHYLMRVDSPKTTFRLGWWWGFGFFLAGLYWICISMTVDPIRFGWMIPFALFGLNGGLALFTGLACWLFAKLKRNCVIQNWLLFAVLVFASEWLRGNILTGFPWNLIGYAWGASDSAIQIAAYLPIYPLTFFTIVLASSSALWPKRWPVLISLIALAAMLVLPMPKRVADMPTMRLVQPNIPQALKHDPSFAREAFERMASLSKDSDAEFIIWPESALPFSIDARQPLPEKAFDWLKDGQTLIAGTVVRDEDEIFNSIIAVNGQGKLLARYDKQHLVPFGEYVPFREILPVERIVPGFGDFTPGTRERALLSFHPLVCYEVIFGSYAKGGGPIILNLTNDDWFGYSSGPFQHLTMARFRAVEQGKPLIRVANSGVSTVIDANGRMVKSLPLHEEGVINVTPYTGRH